MERDLIDVKKVSQILGGLNVDHVRNRIITRADFPRAFRIGGKILFDKPEILDWLESRRKLSDGRRTPNSRPMP